MGSYKPRHLKHEPSLVSNVVGRRGLAVAAATATVVPVALAESASAAPAPAAVAAPVKAAPVKTAGWNVAYGSTGYYVELLQYRLQRAGYSIAKDRQFGPKTLATLRSFQWRKGLAVTGWANDATWRALGGVPGMSVASTSRSTVRTASSSSIVRIAQQYHGVPYVWGGTTPRGFDCSGFTQYVYRKAGINIPRTASAQQSAARRVYTPQPGDLVFSGFPAYHVSIYAGNGYEVSARMPGTVIVTKKIYGYKSYGRF